MDIKEVLENILFDLRALKDPQGKVDFEKIDSIITDEIEIANYVDNDRKKKVSMETMRLIQGIRKNGFSSISDLGERIKKIAYIEGEYVEGE